nr:hypothetical protein [Rhodobacter sp. NTK016B]
MRPTVTLGHDSARGGAHFTRLLSHVASGTDERSVRITSTYYDAIARVFIDELMATAPGLDRAAAVRGYLNAVAIGISLMAPTGRRQMLSDGVLREEDVDAMLDAAVRFIAVGIRALARPSG